jgi:hypothetical protein
MLKGTQALARTIILHTHRYEEHKAMHLQLAHYLLSTILILTVVGGPQMLGIVWGT